IQTARDLLAQAGPPALGQAELVWEMDAPADQQLSLPSLLLGAVAVHPNRDFQTETPLVDAVAKLTRGDCALFQRMNAAGDLLCVATTQASDTGQRAIGARIIATDANGLSNPIIAALHRGETVRAPQAGDQLVVAVYEPLRDAAGEWLGALCVSAPAAGLESLRQTLLSTQVGKTGYLAVVGGRGAQRGCYLLSKDGQRDGECIWEARDAQGQPFVQHMISRALQAPPGQCLYERYTWQNPGEDHARDKMAAIIYFAPWDWVIFSTSYEDDFYRTQHQIRAAFNRLAGQAAGSGLLVLLVAAGIAFLLGRHLARPFGLISGALQQVAAGDMQGARAALGVHTRPGGHQAAAARQQDEVGQLFGALDGMAAGLAALMGQVQQSCSQVTSSTMQISASAQQLGGAVTEQAAATQQVNATSREIATTAEVLARTMDEVGQTVVQTAAAAQTGRSDLARTESAMQRVIKATAAIAAQLSVINDRAGKISGVVTTINKISDQTNMLSLNAAIEAEKAGEYGKGFAVVARETNRLAEQTAIATQDIERMIREMQSSVTGGVQEMDQFAEEVRRGVQAVGAISGHLGEVISRVQAVEARFASVKEGMG
ncbi:MAG: methyl-accepting chemotaxis protein, partial [Lentisphaerae bacterium]|nr:methyl-accepting chemotaxis protein [Lentisphaerota bacterium]